MKYSKPKIKISLNNIVNAKIKACRFDLCRLNGNVLIGGKR